MAAKMIQAVGNCQLDIKKPPCFGKPQQGGTSQVALTAALLQLHFQ